MGVDNHLLGLVLSCFPAIRDIMKKHSITRHGYNGGGLDGNNAIKFLKNLPDIQQDVPAHLHPVLDTLSAFERVVEGCFSSDLA